jgi:hypothetical protein
MPRIESELEALPRSPRLSTRARALLSVIAIVSGAGAIAPAHAEPPGTQQPVPVTVQNTPLPVAIQNQPVAVIPAERAGLVVQGTVAAAQSGTWTVGLAEGATVNLPARKIFRAQIRYVVQPVTNGTNDLLVIDRVSGLATDSQRYFEFFTTGTVQDESIFLPATYAGGANWIVNGMTQIYLKPGEALQLCCNDQTAYLSGHYEPLAQP